MNLLIIRVRGVSGMRPLVVDTFASLGLHRPYNSVIVEDSPVIRGQLQILRGFILNHPLTEDMASALTSRFGSLPVGPFRLSPPVGGFLKSMKTTLHTPSFHERVILRIL